jgi:hypothetical protein
MVPLWETDPVEELRKGIDTGDIEFYFGDTARAGRVGWRCAAPLEFRGGGKTRSNRLGYYNGRSLTEPQERA